MDQLSEASCFATRAFDGMTRKCENNPAILHSLEAAAIAVTVTEGLAVINNCKAHLSELVARADTLEF